MSGQLFLWAIVFLIQCFPVFIDSYSLERNNNAKEFNFRCPAADKIYPCDCLELQKGLESEFYDNESIALEDEVPIEPHPDIIETVVFCKNIHDKKALVTSVQAFKGHRINYLVIDSCSLPSFPNSLFKEINILWMEILNSTVQFREQFFECASNCL